MTMSTSTFEIPGIVHVGVRRGGMTAITITSPLARAEIYLHGGHVTQFQPAGEEPLLWLSEHSVFDRAKAIRGGVPICFPWFGAKAGDALAPAHGFARLMDWRLVGVEQARDGTICVELELASSEQTKALWGAKFIARQTISVGRALSVTFAVANTSGNSITFEAALHTYFAIGDIAATTISGFGGTRYTDALDGGAEKAQVDDRIAFVGETDRVYFDVPARCVLHDPAVGRDVEVVTRGARDAVVWNPWAAKVARMADFGADEWRGMVCIETANVKRNAVVLPAGQSHEMGVTIRVVPR